VNELQAYFEELAERWDGLQSPNRREVLRGLLSDYAPLSDDCSAILEVGTGTGALMSCLRECAPDACVISVDLAFEMLHRARQRERDALLVQADAHYLPFARIACVGAGFDWVICHNSFPHFADKPAALLSLASVLRPGGYMLILHDSSRERVNEIHSGGANAIRNDLLPDIGETYRMLVEAGFEGVIVEDGLDRYVATGWRPREP